jgi:hypothetical protein
MTIGRTIMGVFRKVRGSHATSGDGAHHFEKVLIDGSPQTT